MITSLLSILIFTTFTFASPNQVDTIFVSANTTWNKGTIQCDTPIVVDSGVTLTIAPGARCLFAPGIPLICRGKLLAKGTTSDSIHFAPAQPPQYWGGITLDGNGADNSILEFCRVTYAAQPYGGGLCSRDAKTIISHSHFANDSAGYDGGAIYVDNDTLQICSTTIAYNKALIGYGGGIFCRGRLVIGQCVLANNESFGKFGGGAIVFGTCFVFQCEFNLNTAGSTGFGGGLLCQTDTAIIVENNFTQNSASNGGALYSKNYTMIENNTFTSNTALEPIGIGGGFSCNGSTIITGNTLSSNSADSGVGGGIYITGQSVMMNSNTFYNNQAYLSGGGVQINTNTAKIINNSIVNNSALLPKSFGGGLVLNAALEIFTNNTISNNKADNAGGVYHTPSDTSVFLNSVFWGNTPGQINNHSFIFCNYSCVQNGWQGTSVITSYPLFNDSANGDYTIISPSQCINGGTPDTTGLSLPVKALNGVARITHGRVDIGAFEYDGPIDNKYQSQMQKPACPLQAVINGNRLTISFKLSFLQKIKLDLYSLDGKLISTIFDGTLQAGHNTVTIDRHRYHYAGGCYIIRMKTGLYTVSRMVTWF